MCKDDGSRVFNFCLAKICWTLKRVAIIQTPRKVQIRGLKYRVWAGVNCLENAMNLVFQSVIRIASKVFLFHIINTELHGFFGIFGINSPSFKFSSLQISLTAFGKLLVNLKIKTRDY